MIKSKIEIINYFKSGIKETKDFKIGIEHEKFLFNKKNNKRVDYFKIKEMFNALSVSYTHLTLPTICSV